jgi:uncharacterized protein (DUF427 family)
VESENGKCHIEGSTTVMKAIWNSVTLAESDKTLVVENNHYFPPNPIHKKYFRDSNTHTNCPRKGEASYYHIVVGAQINTDAAWYYPKPKQEATQIKNYIALWHRVKLTE